MNELSKTSAMSTKERKIQLLSQICESLSGLYKNSKEKDKEDQKRAIRFIGSLSGIPLDHHSSFSIIGQNRSQEFFCVCLGNITLTDRHFHDLIEKLI